MSKIKRAAFVVLSLMVALSFIFSIGAFGNNNLTSQTNTSKPTTIPPTYFMTGSANVIVTGYSATATVYSNTKNAFVTSAVNSTLSAVESNGTISSYFPEGSGSYQLLFTNTSTFNPYDLQQVLYAKLGANTTVVVNATAAVLLPPILSLDYGTQKVSVYPRQLNYSMALSPLLKPGTTAAVSVQALVTTNGSIYNNQIQLKLKPS